MWLVKCLLIYVAILLSSQEQQMSLMALAAIFRMSLSFCFLCKMLC